MVEGLYLITDQDRQGQLLEKVQNALKGGAQIVQYRGKNKPIAEQVFTAQKLLKLCRQAGATFLVNDSPLIARDSGADGVHLGQNDTTVDKARQIMGPGKIVGVSTHTTEQALKAKREGADYIGVGSIYPTTTKSDVVLVGLKRLTEIRQAVKLPIVAIGGITRDRTPEVIGAGADSVAVVSAVMNDPDPAAAAREITLLFNRRNPFPRGRVLTVAGSDSSGGAGIQADLKTITLLGSYGMSVITALTAQNTMGVRNIYPAPLDCVKEQLEAVLSDIGTDTVKTGMLFSAEIIRVVVRALKNRPLLTVIDPVMIAKGGASLLHPTAVAALCGELLPCAYLITPNLPETEALTGLTVRKEKDMEKAAQRLKQMGARNVLIKGGHMEGEAVDLLVEGDRLHRFPAPRFDTLHTHGTGCTYSAAIATFLAQGIPLVQAVTKAKIFITEAIRNASGLGAGHGPVNHYTAARKMNEKI
jgi:hydroxymethylpyrimidine kinase / phosphomethylpyrimidine kinase / thiamine-phosphate diphosphorylase